MKICKREDKCIPPYLVQCFKYVDGILFCTPQTWERVCPRHSLSFPMECIAIPFYPKEKVTHPLVLCQSAT